MTKTLSSHYRVESKWPFSGWRWVPEHEGLTLPAARAVFARGAEFKGMRQRIVRSLERVISTG
jgi:hypothetical protein